MHLHTSIVVGELLAYNKLDRVEWITCRLSGSLACAWLRAASLSSVAVFLLERTLPAATLGVFTLLGVTMSSTAC